MNLRTVVFEGVGEKWLYEHVVDRINRKDEARVMEVGLLKTALRSLCGELLKMNLVRKRADTCENRVNFPFWAFC